MSLPYENTNYKVVVGEILEEDSKVKGYQVINKKFDVIEAETRIFPQAMKYADDLDAAVFAFSDMKEVGRSPKVTPINKSH